VEKRVSDGHAFLFNGYLRTSICFDALLLFKALVMIFFECAEKVLQGERRGRRLLHLIASMLRSPIIVLITAFVRMT